ncbi:MAG TPA: alpha/beta hydrolase [Acidimicrobiia bacterium]|jgi:pimeloyl-ACP methyl ester carboxylesterase
MDLHTLESHRRTVGTRTGDVSCIDVGEGPPALFVHGVGTNAYLWRNVLDRLAAERRCIALDLPLHGHSPATPDQDLTLDGLADAVDAFCEADGLVNIDLVAHDTGGAVAQIVAARRPERLRTFTLTNCDVHDNVPPEAFAPTVELAKAGALAPSAPALLADLGAARTAVFGTGYEHPEQLDLEIVRAFLEPVIGAPERARRFEELLAAMEPRYLLAVEPALARLEVPTLVVWGTADEFFDVKWAYWLRDLIPGAREVVEIEGAKLFFPDERAGELVPHLRRHWAGASSERVAS